MIYSLLLQGISVTRDRLVDEIQVFGTTAVLINFQKQRFRDRRVQSGYFDTRLKALSLPISPLKKKKSIFCNLERFQVPNLKPKLLCHFFPVSFTLRGFTVNA